jgi:Annexin
MKDAAFLRDFSDGFGLDDDNLIEIVCTRSNAELQVNLCNLKGRNVRCTSTSYLHFFAFFIKCGDELLRSQPKVRITVSWFKIRCQNNGNESTSVKFLKKMKNLAFSCDRNNRHI